MRHYVFIVLSILGSLSSISAQTVSHFNIEDGRKILGEPVKGMEKSMVTEGKIKKYKYVFKAMANDTLPENKQRTLDCMVEIYPTIASSSSVFLSVKKSNLGMSGFNILPDIQDEGCIQTDRENFYFLIIRKGNKLLRMKLNKISSRSSFKVFETIGRMISKKM